MHMKYRNHLCREPRRGSRQIFAESGARQRGLPRAVTERLSAKRWRRQGKSRLWAAAMFCREPDFAERAAYGKGPFCRRAFFAERSSRQNSPLRRELLLAERQAHGDPVSCRRLVFAESRSRQMFSLPRARVFALGKNLGSRQRTFFR